MPIAFYRYALLLEAPCDRSEFAIYSRNRGCIGGMSSGVSCGAHGKLVLALRSFVARANKSLKYLAIRHRLRSSDERANFYSARLNPRARRLAEETRGIAKVFAFVFRHGPGRVYPRWRSPAAESHVAAGSSTRRTF